MLFTNTAARASGAMAAINHGTIGAAFKNESSYTIRNGRSGTRMPSAMATVHRPAVRRSVNLKTSVGFCSA